MACQMEMLNSLICLICLLFLMFSAALGTREECPELRCKHHGPSIHFPFRLKGRHPDHCGYPGFDLSCSETKDIVLELPGSVKFYVSKIDYNSQRLHVSDPTDCLARHMPILNLSASPFQLGYKYIYGDHYKDNYILFNCSTENRKISGIISCLSGPAHQVIAFQCNRDVMDFEDVLPCTRMHEVSSNLIRLYQKNDMLLSWFTPNCKQCQEQGMICQLTKNSSNSETECSHKRHTGASQRKLIIAGAIVGLFFLVIVIIVLYQACKSDKLEKENQLKIKSFLKDYKTLKPTRYSYADIKRITDDFEEELGRGAYGTVFKGKLSNEILVAVKVLNSTNGNGEEFLNEVGTMGRIHHVNVVRLVGFCADGFRRALVYEYLPNDSLQKFISSTAPKNHSLGWEKLQNIAIGIAKGIEYLHQGCDQQILHFDIKPHNILLDHNLNPKISDFGLAKLCSKDQSVISMTTARGTWGYIAPEVFSRNFGNVSQKANVYSFGMLLLEMVRGRSINNDVKMESIGLVNYPKWIGFITFLNKEKNDESKLRK